MTLKDNWNYRKIKKIINYFGHEAFLDRTVLDLGCETGDIGAALARLGARVISVDARQQHLLVAKKKYPHLTTVCVDLEQSWPFSHQEFDFVLNLGLICHLQNYKEILKKSCEVGKVLILESEIIDSSEDKTVMIGENRLFEEGAFNGVALKPSTSHVEKLLTEFEMEYQRLDIPDLNAGNFKYDWQPSNTDQRSYFNRRFWIAHPNGKRVFVERLPVNNSPSISLPSENSLIQITENLPRQVNKHNKRVALCISAHLRGYQNTFSDLQKSLLQYENPDIFIHTWDKLGAPLRGFDGSLVSQHTTHAIPVIKRLFNPAEIIIEPSKKFPTVPAMHLRNYEHREINAVLSMFYKITACNQLKLLHEQNEHFTYDVVIRHRSDLQLLQRVYIPETLEDNTIYIPISNDFNGINDQFAFGNSRSMDLYSSIFTHINRYMSESNVDFNPEKLLLHHLQEMKLKIIRFPLNYRIFRAAGRFF